MDAKAESSLVSSSAPAAGVMFSDKVIAAVGRSQTEPRFGISVGVAAIPLLLLLLVACELSASETPRPPRAPHGTDAVIETCGVSAVVLHEDEFWRLTRLAGTGYLDVYHRDRRDAPWKYVDLALDWRRNTYPMAVLATVEHLVAVGYDVVANVPSGRRLESVRNGVDVDEIYPDTNGHPLRLAEGLPIGGIDTNFVIAAAGEAFLIAGENRIVRISRGQPTLEWDTSTIRDYEIVEIEFDANEAAAIVRRRHDDRKDGCLTETFAGYHLASIDPRGSALVAIKEEGVPWQMRWTPDGPKFQLARKPAELGAVFLHDLNRMRHGGIMDLGGNNLEGRVAWSQAYYLNGMLTMLSGPLLKHIPEAEPVLRKRIAIEIQLLARLVVSDWPGLMCQRYSVGREPLCFALHVGRTLVLLLRAKKVLGSNKIVSAAIVKLQHSFADPTACVEVPGTDSERGQTFQTLAYQRRFPFWADGCNVPFNFLSGIVCGLLGETPSDEAIQQGESLMQPLLQLELSDQTKFTWRYWWGRGDTGWSRDDSVSVNTPSWGGNKSGVADISYRSIDAMAVLALARCRPGSVSPATVSHLRNLTSNGWLWPHVNQELELTSSPAPLSRNAAMRFSRSSTAAGLQSQPWALADLARQSQP